MKQIISRLAGFIAGSPARVLVLGFSAMIALGTCLLALPIAAAPAHSIGIVNAFFTSTSAVCVTGLVVKDPATDFSLFGQLVILLLIQIGGLGYMTMATVMALLLGRKLSLRDRLVLREALNVLSMEGLVRFTRNLIGLTLLIEALGALLLTARFALDSVFLSKHSLLDAIYFGFFHSVSAFNNAGFSLFSENLIPYRSDLVVNGVITTLIILGGIGFIVYSDLYRRYRGEIQQLSLHTKLAVTTTISLIVAGTALFFFSEFQRPETIGNLSLPDQFLVSYFHAVSARTAGFNTVDLSKLSTVALYLLMLLMFIGASPGGTGGGIKTTTFGTIVIDLWTTLRGQVEAGAYHRRIAAANVAKAYLITAVAFIWLTVASFVLLGAEHLETDKYFLRVMFEVTSALGTVGLSTGDGGILSFAALFNSFGKLVIAVTMLVGRVGPLTLGAAVLRSQEKSRVRYPEGEVLIG